MSVDDTPEQNIEGWSGGVSSKRIPDARSGAAVDSAGVRECERWGCTGDRDSIDDTPEQKA